MASSACSPLPTSYMPSYTPKVKRSKLAKTSPVIKDENNANNEQRQYPWMAELPSKEQFLQLAALLAVAAIVATSATYIIDFSHRYFKPFCDSAADLEALSDTCIPCPMHGRCWEGKLECFPGYKRQGRTCKEDTELDKKAQKVAHRIKDHACGKYAQALCNGAGIFRLPMDNVTGELNQLDLMGQFNLKADEMLLLQKKAMEIIRGSFDTVRMLDGSEEFKCPDWLAEKYKPFGCRTREWISRNYLFLFLVSPMVLAFTKFLWRLYQRKRMMARAEQLYQQVCEQLEEKALMEKSKGAAGEPWVVTSRLRDHLLLPRERKNTTLWKKVEELIQEDSRIDQYPKLVKGESRIVLEWQVEGALRSQMRHGDVRQRVS